MGEVVKFPIRNPQEPDQRLWTADQYAHRGEVQISLGAMQRWVRGFDPFDAAVICATAASDEAATEWWRNHVARFRAELRARGLREELIEDLRRAYTSQVRTDIRSVRKMRLTLEDWRFERVGAVVAQPLDPSPVKMESGDVR